MIRHGYEVGINPNSRTKSAEIQTTLLFDLAQIKRESRKKQILLSRAVYAHLEKKHVKFDRVMEKLLLGKRRNLRFYSSQTVKRPG